MIIFIHIKKLVKTSFFFFILSSCSFLPVGQRDKNLNAYKKINKDEARSQLEFLAKELIASKKITYVKIDKAIEDYLKEKHNQFRKNLPSFFSKKVAPLKFKIIKDKSPFFFSLPGNYFFFSSSLIKKFLNNEQIFLAAFASEMIRGQHNIFKRKTIIPVGEIHLERLISMVRIPESERVKMWKWAYFALQKSGIDGSAVLNLIQLQNKNSVEFIYMLGGKHNLSKEEFLFKNFLSKQKSIEFQEKRTENTSKYFYRLLKRVR